MNIDSLNLESNSVSLKIEIFILKFILWILIQFLIIKKIMN